MSTESHYTPTSAKSEHGTTTSYIVGFILSLILTINAYFLVVNKVLTGNALLLAILGLGVLQMAIQLLFFLHLGRGPKPLYNIVFFFMTAGIIVMTIGASVFIMDNLYRNMSPSEVILKQSQEENISQVGSEQTGACTETNKNLQVTIKGNSVTPANIQANRCDTLTFINEGDKGADIVFGSYPTRISYGGEDGVSVPKGYPVTITLNQSGDFKFFDSVNTTMIGQFTVAP
jgi:cytochrome o ubiquinol oxidase operon protein cyoD